MENPPYAHLILWRLPLEPSSKTIVGLALLGAGAKPETQPLTPALLATTALEGIRPVQEPPRPALNTPIWLQKEARVWQSASLALPGTTACPQVSLPSKASHVLQATGVQVIRVPFSVHLAPFEQSQGHHPKKTVSSVPLATTAPRLSFKIMQICL